MSRRTVFDTDPFFADVDLPRALALEHRSRHNNHGQQITSRQNNANRQLDVFGNPFAYMQNIMNDMGQMMNQMQTGMNNYDVDGQLGHGVSFSSSTMMSMDQSNGGKPRIIQATSEKLRGPEGK
jgi:hypothetical protein